MARTGAQAEERRIREAETRNEDDVRMAGIPLSRQRAGARADDGEQTLYLVPRGGWQRCTIGGSKSWSGRSAIFENVRTFRTAGK